MTILWTLALTIATANAPQIPPIGLPALESLDHLPLLRDFVCLQQSSYDRTGGNDDGFSGRFTTIRIDDNGDHVIFDAEGPGCIYRLWSAMPPEGAVKFYFDGERAPRLTCTFRDLFEGEVPPFAPPMTGKSSGGWYSYHPIPFERRCVITTERVTGFLAIAYHKYRPGTRVVSFTPRLPPEDKAAYDKTQAWYRDLAADEVGANMPLKWTSLAPGKETTVADLRGPATIRSLHMKLRSDAEDGLRKTVLRVYWDGAKRPAIECPVGDLVGTGFGDVRPAWNPGSHLDPMEYAAVPFGMTRDFYYFRLPMPFRRSARVTVESGLPDPVEFGWAADVRRGGVPDNAAYLHVQWRDYYTKTGEHVPILDTVGRGHFVGTLLSMQSPWWLTYLEGDEKFYVDGETDPSIHGTGTEDYFNCGWYFNQGPTVRPYHGITVIGDPQSRTSEYRMHIPDCVPFRKSLRVQIEHGESNNKPNTNYAIVAYWYLDRTEHERPVEFPPASELRLPGTVLTDYENWNNLNEMRLALNMEAGIRAGGGDARFAPMRDIDPDTEGPQRLIVTADRPGAYARWTFNAPVNERYTIQVACMRRPDFGVVEMLVDDKPVGRADLYFDRFAHEVTLQSEPVELAQGRHTLEVRVVDKGEKSTGYGMVVSAWRSDQASPYPKKWNLIGPFPAGDDIGYGTVFPPEKGVDLSASYAGVSGDVTWKQIDAGPVVWLHDLLRAGTRVVAFAHTYVKCPSDREATALVAVDDAGKLFINGELVWAVPGINEVKVERYSVPIRLKAGWNEVLLKAGQNDGAWGYSFRILDPSGDLQYSPTKE